MGKGKKKSSVRSIFTIIILVGVAVVLAWGWFGTSITAEDDMLKIKGLHAQEIEYLEIDNISLHNELPVITAKTGGFSLAGKRLGNFATKEFGIIKLFLYNNTGPFIYVEKEDGKMIIFNMEEPAATRDIYHELGEQSLGRLQIDD